MSYRLVRAFARLLLHVFYRRVDVAGIERVPLSGPLVLASNHHEALVDPMLILTAVPRRLRPIAKAPLFRHPVIAPFLRMAGAIPVHRRQDAGSDPAKNEAMFSAAIATLGLKGAILIFPEGVSHSEPTLIPLRTGAARMLLGAEALAGGRLGVTLLPVGLIFHEPGSFRTGWALVLVGDPVPTGDCVALYGTDPETAVRRLTDRLTEALRKLIVEADDRETLHLFEIAEAIWREESLDAAHDVAARAAWIQRATRAHRYLKAREPARISGLVRRVERYAKELERTGLRGRELAQRYSARVIASYSLREGFSLLLGLPLALSGITNHLIPYQLTALAIRLIRPASNAEATYKLGAAIVLFPLCWAGEGWTAWQLGGGGLLALFLAFLIPTGFFALTWRGRLRRFAHEARSFLRFLMDRDLPHHLRACRRALMDELTELANRVPESTLAGQREERP